VATPRGAAAARPLPRPRPEGPAAARWPVCAWVTAVCVHRGGLQGLQFQGTVPFLAIARAIL
jgi:hypothetical protein